MIFYGNAKCLPKNPEKLFLEFQDRWIKDKSRLKLGEKSRQVGWTWCTAYATVERTAPKENKNDQWISSRDDIQAKLFLEDCKMFAGVLNAVANDLGVMVLDDGKRLSAYVVEFANSKRINSMSSNPDAQAGKRGGRVLDEFALHPDPRKLYSIAYPGITWGGQLEIFSTHRGSANFFNELVVEVKEGGNPKGFSLHTVTLETALNQGFLYKLQQAIPKDDPIMAMDEQEYFDFIRKGCASEEQFLQEYMCIPADDAGAFLTYDMIAACEYRPGDKWEMTGNERELYLGVDVGRVSDLTTMWVLEHLIGNYFTRKNIELQGMTFSAQEAVLYELLENPAVRRCCIDSTGLGMQFAERAQEKFGTYRVEAVRFSAQVKEELAYPVRAAFEDKAIKIPKDDKIRADLRGIKKVTTAAGNIRFEADRGPDGHSDRFWALALALHAASTPPGDIKYESISKRRFSRQGAW